MSDNATSPTGPNALPVPEREFVFKTVSLSFVIVISVVFIASSSLYLSRQNYFPINRSLPYQVLGISLLTWFWTLTFAIRILLRYSTYPCSLNTTVDDLVILALSAAYISRILTVYLRYRKSLALSIWSATRSRNGSIVSVRDSLFSTDFSAGASNPSATDQTISHGNPIVRLFRLLRLPARKYSKIDPVEEAMTNEEVSLFLAQNNSWLIVWGPNVLLSSAWMILCCIPRFIIFFLTEFWVHPNQYSPLCYYDTNIPMYQVMDTARYYFSFILFVVFVVGIVVSGALYVRKFEEGLGIKQEMLLALLSGLAVLGVYMALGLSRALYVEDLFVFPRTSFVFFLSHLSIIIALLVIPTIRSFRNIWRSNSSDVLSISSYRSSHSEESELMAYPGAESSPNVGGGEPHHDNEKSLSPASPLKPSTEGSAITPAPGNEHTANEKSNNPLTTTTTTTTTLSPAKDGKKAKITSGNAKKLGLEQVLSYPTGIVAFRAFLTKEFALESLLFYMDVQEFKRRCAARRAQGKEEIPKKSEEKLLQPAPSPTVMQTSNLDGEAVALANPGDSSFQKKSAESVVSTSSGGVGANQLALPKATFAADKMLIRYAARIVLRYIHPSSEMAVNLPGSLITPLIKLFPWNQTLHLLATSSFIPPQDATTAGTMGDQVQVQVHGSGTVFDSDFLSQIDLNQVIRMLEDAAKHIMILMRTDTFIRFRQSPEFKAWISAMEVNSMA